MRSLKRSFVAVVRLASLVVVAALFVHAPAQAESIPPETVVRPGEAARQAFQASWSVPYTAPGDGQIQVPAGKRLVLAYASLKVSDKDDCRVGSIGLTTTAGGTQSTHFVPVSVFTLGGRSQSVAGQLVQLFADPATQVFVGVDIDGTNCNPGGVVSVSGYFVDLL
ncbi:MAG: hypothetical protein KBD01_13760 [Acidobacteria bacterium]|nr:hypothetical protein [Acidobacteriota bacterium]